MDGKLRRDIEEIEWKIAYLRNVKRKLKVCARKLLDRIDNPLFHPLCLTPYECELRYQIVFVFYFIHNHSLKVT